MANLKKTVAVVTKYQLVGCLDHPTSTVRVTKCGKDKEESAWIGNEKLQLIEWITKITQMAYRNQ